MLLRSHPFPSSSSSERSLPLGVSLPQPSTLFFSRPLVLELTAMFKSVYFALIALAAVSLVNGAAILRSTPPSGWVSEAHEVSVFLLFDR